MLETFRGVVRPHHLDHMGHMNVQWYAKKFDDATWHLFAYAGLTNAYFQAEKRGMAALRQVTEYKAEAMAGDLLVCHSQLLEVGNKTMRFIHKLTDAQDGHLVATSELLGTHLDTEARRSCVFPNHIRERCDRLIAESAIDSEA